MCQTCDLINGFNGRIMALDESIRGDKVLEFWGKVDNFIANNTLYQANGPLSDTAPFATLIGSTLNPEKSLPHEPDPEIEKFINGLSTIIPLPPSQNL